MGMKALNPQESRVEYFLNILINEIGSWSINSIILVMSLQISCTLCSKPFTALNPPRIAKKCPHTYCEACIQTAQACPMDKIPFQFAKLGIDSFHINRTIVKMLKLNLQPSTATEQTKPSPPPLTPKSDNKKGSQKKLAPPKPEMVREKSREKKVEPQILEYDESDKCLLHNKQLDLVCIDHAVKVCSNCALFGEHKNHNVKPIQSLIGECAGIAEYTLGILTDIKEHEATINEQYLETQITETFKNKREEIAKSMRGTFTKIIDKIRKQERLLITHLDKLIESSKQELLNKVQYEECSKKKETWIAEAKQLLRIIDSFPSYTKVEEASAYLKADTKESTLVERGGYVLVELEMFDKIFQQKLAASVAEIAAEVSPQIDSQIEGWYKIIKTSSKDEFTHKSSLTPRLSQQKSSNQKNQEDQLLEQLSQMPKELEQQYTGGYGYNTFINTTDASSNYGSNNFTYDNHPMQYLSSFDQQPHFDSFTYSNISGKNTAPKPLSVQNKKVKKVKVPEKYEAVLQDLMVDRSDCIDFTNAELGDTVVLGLCDYIRGSTKLKTLKLIRCKLTDDVMQSLLDACRDSRVTSLNLGQNMLTEQTLQLMSKFDLGEIKSITLSQNKVNQRSSKNKIAEMKARGIVLSV